MVTRAEPETGKRPKTGEQTRGQVKTSALGSILGKTNSLPASYETYRQMRKHPTIAMARALSVAPIVAAEWSVVADEGGTDEMVEFIKAQFLEVREPLIESALLGGIDFGHQGYEKVFVEDGSRLGIKKFKPLLQDKTELLIDEDTGAFAGFKQDGKDLPIEKCLLIPFRVEGTQWHGYPLLENAREQWNQWRQANDGAARYDNRLAGAHWVVYYPAGTTLDENGVEKDNVEIAKRILDSLEASSSIAVPQNSVAKDNPLEEMPEGWKIEIMGDGGGRQPAFIDRLRYLDTMMVRALLLPERAVTEGQFGTKAEAESHIDLALTNAEVTHRHVVRLINWHAVDQLLAINWGESARGAVRIEPGPLRDDDRDRLRQFYKDFITNPQGFMQESEWIDTDAIRDRIGIPTMESPGEAIPRPPMDGVDPNDPMAAAVVKLYRDGMEPEEPEVDPTLETSEDRVLNGAQIKAATEIVQAVADRLMPRDAGIGQLEVLFNLTAEQAERIMGSAGAGFEPKKKEPVPNAFQPQPPGVATGPQDGAGDRPGQEPGGAGKPDGGPTDRLPGATGGDQEGR